jgi:hypothetical protein
VVAGTAGAVEVVVGLAVGVVVEGAGAAAAWTAGPGLRGAADKERAAATSERAARTDSARAG